MPEARPGVPHQADTSSLHEADWAALDKLNAAFKGGGTEALVKAQAELIESDFIVWFRIVRTFFPELTRKLMKDRKFRLALAQANVASASASSISS